MGASTQRLSFADAEHLAIKAITFISGDEVRLDRFLSLTGWTPDSLKQDAGRPAFLMAILDHLSSDESLLLTFAAETGTDPALVGNALLTIENIRSTKA